jgi:predicted DNA-binding protein (MmcQ/YjbR family)
VTREELDALCLAFPGAVVEQPFGPETDVYKVAGKVFAIAPVGADPVRVNLKCDPFLAERLREEFPDQVTPGYHMNKRHWNTVVLDGSLPGAMETELVEDSYDLIVDALPKAKRPAG